MSGVAAPSEKAAGAALRPDAGQVLRWLEDVADPEIPVLSVIDLGVVRDVRVSPARVEVFVAPTYSACPAMEVIEQAIFERLAEEGVRARVHRVLSPPWTTDWISEEGRQKLHAYGIAPPERGAGRHALAGSRPPVACPRCASTDTRRVSEFGSTPCKASFKCRNCLEPFEHFKCI